MRRVLGLLLLLVLVVVGVGIYRDWFHFSTSREKDGGNINVDMKIDRERIKADTEAVRDKAKSVGLPVKTATPNAPAEPAPNAGTPNR